MSLALGSGSAFGARSASAYGTQAARNTTSYPATAVGSAHSTSIYPTIAPPTNPYAAQAAKNTTQLPTNVTGGTYTPPAAAAPAATKTPDAPAGSGAATPAASSVPGWDPTADPVYQQVQAQAAQSRADAESSALASKKQLAIQYGDADLANQLGDTTTAAAAAANPYSTAALLNAQQPKDELALDEDLNKSNLFYSGARITQQGDLADKYGQQRYQNAQDEQAALGGIDQNRLAAILAANNTQDSALSDAYARYLQQLLAAPPTTTAGAGTVPNNDGSGGTYDPIFTSGPDLPAGLTGTQLFNAGGAAAKPNAAGIYPADNAVPVAVTVAANKSGASANKKQGIFAIR